MKFLVCLPGKQTKEEHHDNLLGNIHNYIGVTSTIEAARLGESEYIVYSDMLGFQKFKPLSATLCGREIYGQFLVNKIGPGGRLQSLNKKDIMTIKSLIYTEHLAEA